MRIALDFDGVIVNTGKMKVERAKLLFDVSIPIGRCKAEFVVDRYLTVREYRALTRLVSSGEIGLLAEPMDGALQFVSSLQNEGHELGVVTSRDGEFLNTAILWARLQGLSLPFCGVGHEKSKASALAGYDVFLDDDLSKLADLQGIVPHRFLFSHGYNLHHVLPSGVIRVDSWQEFYDHICRLSRPPIDIISLARRKVS